jgi:hypothetical protein
MRLTGQAQLSDDFISIGDEHDLSLPHEIEVPTEVVLECLDPH